MRTFDGLMTSTTLPLLYERHSDGLMHLASDVAGLQTLMVNLYFLGTPRQWVLVDAGIPMQASRIIAAAERRFGAGAAPEAIILTHGHFDHVGSLDALRRHWNVPIYAHRLEMPYLTGRSKYPPPDPTVGGGAMARSASLYPRHAYDFRPQIQELAEDGTMPGLDGWRWIHTPGHAPGHVSLFRDSDRTLIAGDAFTTQKQESFFAVMTNARRVHGPPMYFTIDWDAAKRSVQALAALEPMVAGTGHGLPMSGEALHTQLTALALHFNELARPKKGRYIFAPAITNERGVDWVPPAPADPFPKVVAGLAVAGIAGAMIARSIRNRSLH
jgi:glyoxylase-like metal-dependent hydrolase (beta-lactamase superfamily II)